MKFQQSHEMTTLLLPVILTRPQLDSETLARKIAAADPELRTIVSPLIRIEYRSCSIRMENYTAVVFTSRNAVRAVAEVARPRAMRAYCVGQSTAQIAREAGFECSAASGTAEFLTRLIVETGRNERLLFLRGRHVSGNLVEQLASRGMSIDEEVVYDQVRLDLNKQAMFALRAGPCVITAFSKRTARILGAQVPEAARISHTVYCLSRNIAGALPASLEAVIASRISEDAIAQELVEIARVATD